MKITFKKIRNILLALLIIVFAQLTLPILFNIQFTSHFWILIFGVGFYLLLFDTNSVKKLPLNAFFLVAIFGTVVSLIKPVQYGLDEESHLPNVISVSDSLFFKYSNEKLSDYDSVFSYDVLRNPDRKPAQDFYLEKHSESRIRGKAIGFDNPAFVPAAIGWSVGRIVSDRIYVSYYLGRIFQVLAYAALVYLALKISKSYREGLYIFATFPAVIYVVAGYHYDYLYFGGSLIAIALLTNFLSAHQKIGKKEVVAFQASILAFAFSKFPMILLGSLLTFLPKKYYKTSSIRLFSSLIFILNLFIGLLYTGIIKLFPTSGSAISGDGPGLFYFITHPLPLLRTLSIAPDAVLHDFIASPLKYVSSGSGFLTAITICLFFSLSFLVILKNKIVVPKIFQAVSAVLFLAVSSLIIIAISGDTRVYHVGDMLVGGVQGRYYYFIIVFLPLLISSWINDVLIKENTIIIEEEKFNKIIQYSIVYLNILTMGVGLYSQL